jgi:hypothetical protein
MPPVLKLKYAARVRAVFPEETKRLVGHLEFFLPFLSV